MLRKSFLIAESVTAGELVEFDSNGKLKAASSATENFAGVVVDDATFVSGEDTYATVYMATEIVKLTSGAAVTAGDLVQVDTTGTKVIKSTAFAKTIGRALESVSGSDEALEVLLL